MITSELGKDLIKSFESLRLEAYLCPAQIPTIGYGHTGKDVKLGMSITKERAEELLNNDLLRFERGVGRLITAPLTQNQFDALVSFSFNLGLGNLQCSTLRMKLNRQDYIGASKEFIRWNKSRVGGGLIVLNGLTRRRIVESNLFLT